LHLQAIVVAIDQHSEAAYGNGDFFEQASHQRKPKHTRTCARHLPTRFSLKLGSARPDVIVPEAFHVAEDLGHQLLSNIQT